jgi:hypothetical protein
MLPRKMTWALPIPFEFSISISLCFMKFIVEISYNDFVAV